MTTNKLEILGCCAKKDRGPWERSNEYYLSPNPDENYTVPLIRLSDYETLQADRDQQYGMKVKARKQRDEVTTKLSALYTECEKLRKDADRYRWLRSNNFGFAHDAENRGISTSRWGRWDDDALDSAIDAAWQGG